MNLRGLAKNSKSYTNQMLQLWRFLEIHLKVRNLGLKNKNLEQRSLNDGAENKSQEVKTTNVASQEVAKHTCNTEDFKTTSHPMKDLSKPNGTFQQ